MILMQKYLDGLIVGGSQPDGPGFYIHSKNRAKGICIPETAMLPADNEDVISVLSDDKEVIILNIVDSRMSAGKIKLIGDLIDTVRHHRPYIDIVQVPNFPTTGDFTEVDHKKNINYLRYYRNYFIAGPRNNLTINDPALIDRLEARVFAANAALMNYMRFAGTT